MDFPLHRFEEFGGLTEREKIALYGAAQPKRRARRRASLREEGVSSQSIFLLVDGWVSASRSIRDGRRQILKVHLPGDALGTPSMALEKTAEELTALTDVIYQEVRYENLARLFSEHPRIERRFLLSVQLERVTLMDRIVSIGKLSGEARVSAFLLDLADRLQPLGLVTKSAFHLILTQEQIGDVIGLTNVHTNRCFKALQRANLISQTGQQVTLSDLAGLERLAQRHRRSLIFEPNWIPEPG